MTSWSEAYFSYHLLGEIVGGVLAFIGVAVIVCLAIYDEIYKGRKKK